MDLNSLLGAFMGADSLTSIGEASNTSASDVASVLTAALPSLLAGATAQANNEETADSFAAALNEHSKDDVSNVPAFIQNVDVKDGNKIVQHLLGNDAKATTDSIAAATGVSKKNTGTILALAAPLLLSMLSGNHNNNTASSSSSLLGNLLGGNHGSMSTGTVMALAAPLLLGMLSGNNNQQQAQQPSLLGSLLGGNQQQAQQPSLLGSLLGGNQQQAQQPSLLGSLLGAQAEPAQPAQQTVDTSAASSLLGALLNGMGNSNENAHTLQQAQPAQQEESASNGLLSGLLGLLK